MPKESELMVHYRREGDDVHFLGMNSPFLPDIRLDYTGVPAQRRAGTATRMLCASALYCFASTLGACLRSRGATIHSLTGKAVPVQDRDENFRMRVLRYRLEIQVDVPEKDKPILEKCRGMMRRGCLVTYSLDEGIEMEYVINDAPAGADSVSEMKAMSTQIEADIVGPGDKA